MTLLRYPKNYAQPIFHHKKADFPIRRNVQVAFYWFGLKRHEKGTRKLQLLDQRTAGGSAHISGDKTNISFDDFLFVINMYI